ncbi:MAG: hypothetical protein AAGJ84_11105 [Pseudomonadota bacterium]
MNVIQLYRWLHDWGGAKRIERMWEAGGGDPIALASLLDQYCGKSYLADVAIDMESPSEQIPGDDRGRRSAWDCRPRYSMAVLTHCWWTPKAK